MPEGLSTEDPEVAATFAAMYLTTAAGKSTDSAAPAAIAEEFATNFSTLYKAIRAAQGQYTA